MSAQPEDFVAQAGAKLHVGVAVDGSALSEKALRTACQVLNCDRGDALTILHVAPPASATSKHLAPTHLEHRYAALAWDAMKAKPRQVPAEFHSVEKTPNQTTCEALTALAATSHVDLLVVGSYGRKGEKIDLLGSVSDYSLREAHASVFIVRSTTPPSEQQVYVFGTDGSRAAAQAFTKLLTLFVRPATDRLVVARMGDGSDKEFFAPYQAAMDKLKVQGECLHWPLAKGQTVAQALLSLANIKNATCLCMGVSGYGQQKLGSVSEEICLGAGGCNTLVLKDPAQQSGEQVSSLGARSIQAMVACGKDKPARDETGTLGRLSRPLGRTSVDLANGGKELRKSFTSFGVREFHELPSFQVTELGE